MRKLYILLILFLSSTCIWAQNMPHVSNIRAEARNHLIRLTWTDSLEAQGSVFVFRSARPFVSTIPRNIRPVEVRYGTQYYIDDTDNLENLFYLIVASDTAGRRFDVIIPEVNSTNVNLASPLRLESNEEELEESHPREIITIPDPTTPIIDGLSNLVAILNEDKVTISFNNSNPERTPIIYRSAHPVRRAQDLLNANLVPLSQANVWEDYPVPGQAWYYAVIYEDEILSGNININPGVNSTTTSIIVTSDLNLGRTMRHRPLPRLTLNEMQTGFLNNQTENIPLANETLNILRESPNVAQRERTNLRRPRVFQIDLRSPQRGEDSALFQIVNEQFKNFDWENSLIALQHFVSLPRSKEVEARARFYLGQSYYFLGNYREALMEFLAFRAYHEVEANLWINSVLQEMTR